MKSVSLGKYKGFLPENWEEMQQNEHLFRFAFMLFNKQIPEETLKIAVALRALGVPRWRWHGVRFFWWRFSFISDETAALLAEKMDFLTETVPPTLSENPFLKLGRMVGLKNILSEMTTWEFADAERHFIQASEADEIDKFLAVWYRPNFWGSRTKYDGNYLHRAKYIAQIPNWKKQLVFFFFLGVRKQMAELNPTLFSGKKQSDDASLGWVDTIINLSQPGDEDKTASVPIGTTLRRLELKAIEYEQTKTRNDAIV